MLDSREYLLEECENVRRLLRGTLRYAYSVKTSEDVYGECLARLKLIRSRTLAAKRTDSTKFNELSIQLSKLAQLIGRVERSHIEEFSWPFAAALQSLAEVICRSNEEDAPDPLFFMSADDDLFSYEIRTEEDDPGLLAKPLFNIIFPRSLKSCVLLHPILGHEVAHAAYAVPELGATLEDEVIRKLVANSPLADFTEFQRWVQNSGYPMNADEMTEAVLNWPEELYCDLFALLTMGPAYVAANCTLLLGPQDPSASHPASLTRLWLIDRAMEYLDWQKKSIGSNRYIKAPVERFFESNARASKHIPKRMHLLARGSIRTAIDNLRRLLVGKDNALFDIPHPDELEQMVRRLLLARPPVESTVTANLRVSNAQVDFRAILYAGWLAWHSPQRKHPKLDFQNINMLCDRGILQQSAVDRWAAQKLLSQQNVRT